MIRRLIILLLIVGCVFADTIKYNSMDIDGSYYTKSITGEYAGIYNHKVFVRTEKGGIFEIDCEDVIIIIKDDLSSIEWSCSEETYTPKTLTEADIKKLQKIPIIGGTLIAIGGILLHTYPDDPFCISNECESLDDYKEYADKKQLQWRAGIIFISLGGILVALGI